MNAFACASHVMSRLHYKPCLPVNFTHFLINVNNAAMDKVDNNSNDDDDNYGKFLALF